MKFSIFISLICIFNLSAGNLKSQSLTINYKNVPVKEIFKAVENQSSYRFFYNDELSDVNRLVSVNLVNTDINILLSQVLDNTRTIYKVLENNLIVIAPKETLQQIKITGTVVDGQSGEAIPGANVLVEGTTVGVTTDMNGKFTIELPNAESILVVSYVSYVTDKIKYNGQSNLEIKLVPDVKNLDEVVVVGYGTQKKRDVTGAVASFKAENIDERPLTRVDQALVGQMAGVQVKQTSGIVGKAFSIQVRGTGSISATNEPLYVIDGFPLSMVSTNASGSFSTGNPLDNINPNDIESIQVLKDASSAAIYGSRASNGVVLITTKKGKTGKPKFSFNGYTGISEANRKLDMLNAPEWIDRATEMINAAWVASGTGRTAAQTNEERRVILGIAVGTVNTGYMTDDRWTEDGHPGLRFIDWQDEAFRKGLVQNYQLSASGASEFVNYYISGNYAKQEGMIKGLDYTSYSARANVDINASKKLKFGINITPTFSITNDPGIEGKDNILHQLVSFTPVQEDTMGLYPNTGQYGQYKWSTSANSPIAKLEQKVGKTSRFRTLTSLYGEYQIVTGLFFKTSVNYDITDSRSLNYTPYTVAGTLLTRNTQLTKLTVGSAPSYRRQSFVNENTLAYSKTIAKDHEFALLLGSSYTNDNVNQVTLNSNGGYNSSVVETLNAATGITGSVTDVKNILLSYFGRLQYNYKGRYMLTASMRRDGSSRFGANTKWGAFPSASVGWRVTEEEFMKNIPVVSDFKLRASWGKSGNYNIGDYSSIPVLANYNYSFNSAQVTGQAPKGITNPDITWEESKTIDVGVDFGILQNRISGAFDYYDKLNNKLLLNVAIPGATGFNQYLSNAGEVRNTGWELELTSRNFMGKFQWTTTANLSHTSNKVEKLAGGQDQIWIPSSFDISHSLLKVGESMYSISVVRQIGILSQADIDNGAALYGSETAGDPKYFDASKDGVIDANDRVIVGHPNPDYIWGFTNTFKFQGFDLSIMIQGQNGGSIYSLLGRALGRTGQGFSDNALGAYRNRWRSADDPGDGKVSKAYSTFGRIKNTDWLYSSDYWRIRNITLGYDLGAILKIKAVQSARVYVSIENWFGHDKYTGGFNPEASNTDVSGSTSYPEAGDYGGLPLARSCIFGLNLNF